MSVFDEILNFFFPLKETPSFVLTSNMYLALFIINLLAFLIVFYICWRAFRYWRTNIQYRKQTFPLFLLSFSLLVLRLHNLNVSAVEWLTLERRELFYDFTLGQIIPFILAFIALERIITTYIKVPQHRKRSYKQILYSTRFTIVFLVVYCTHLFYITLFGSFVSTSSSIEDSSLSFVIIFIAGIVILIIASYLRSEIKQNSSKLIRVRIEMVALVVFPTGIAFLLAPMFLVPTIMTRGMLEINFVIRVLFATFFAITTVISAFAVTWTFQAPNWARKRHNLFSPSASRTR